MAAVLEQLSEELAQTPGDQELLKRLAQSCVEAGELGRLKGALEPVFSGLSGPLAVRPAAEALAAALVDAAAKLAARAPRDALDLYLRAAKLLAQVAMDKLAAAKVLATAWQVLPDERVATAAQALFPGTHEVPEYTLAALTEVGGEGPKTAALRKLAAAELERRRLDQAEGLFARLESLRPSDADASAGRQVIAELRASALARTESLDQAIAATPPGPDRGALWRGRGEAARSAGRLAEAEAAFRAALDDGDEAALRPLEALLRETGRVDEVAAVVEALAARAHGDRQVALRKKLFSLLRDELKRPDEAQRVLAAPRSAPAPTAVEVLRSQVEAVAQRDPLAGALRLEELAAAEEEDRQARLVLLERAATLAAGRDPQVEARLWRKVKALDPQSPGALAFHRLFYEAHPDPRRAYSNLLQLHAITADPDARRALAIEMATLAEEGLGQLDKAIDAWRLVERDLPREAETEATQAVWAELRRLYAAAGRWHAYVDLLDRWGAAAAALGDHELQVELLFDIVDVYQDPARLPMPAMVLQTYQRIVALSPTHAVALDRLAVGLAEREQWTDLLQVLAQKVELTDDPSELVALFQQIADLYLDHVRSESQAIVVLERLLELTPDDLDVVRRLRDLYRRRHDSERHLNALTRELELTSDPDERMRIFSDLAKLAQDELLRPVDAIAYHREILTLAPAHEPSLAALQALHAEQEDWGAYAKVLEQRVAEAKTKAAKLPLLLELGEAMLTRLGDVERAEQIFSAIAESSPTSATARRFLQRIFVSRKKWDELGRLFTKTSRTTPAAPGSRWKEYVALLRDAVKHEVDPPLVAAIHVEIARVFEVELDDRKSAAEHLELALRASEDEVPWARKALELLGEDALGPRRLVALTTIARHAPDARECYQAWMSIGLIHRRAKDSVHACDAWGRALVLGVELGLIEALAHLEEDAGATGRWEQAFLAIDEALGHLPTADGDGATLGLRVALHRALGNIARARLLRPEEAVRHFKWVLQLAPGDAFALEELEKIYFSLNDLSGLEEVYRARIDAARNDGERAAPLHALARLFDDVLLDPERAAGTYQEILRLVPDDRVAQDALLRTLEASGASAEVASVLEGILARTRDPERRQGLQWRLAELFANDLADPLGAIDHCREIIERAEPGQADLIARPLAILEGYAAEPMLAREVAPVLEVAYRKLARLVDLARLLEVQAKTAPPEALPGILDELVMLAQGALDDPKKAFDIMLQRFRLTPEEPELWAELERAAGPLDAWEGLAAAWKARVEAEPEMAPEARALLRLRLAEVYHRRLIELEDAIVETERALSETHDDAVTLRALESLEVLFKKTADLDSFVRVKLESARRVLSRASRRQKVVEAAQALAGALGRPEDALGVLEPLWLEEPGDVELADLVLALAERLGDNERTDQFFGDAIESAHDDARRDALRYRRALVRRDRLGLWEVAISELIDLVESPHAGRDARQALLDLCRAQESAAQRDVVLEVLVEHYRRVRDTEGTISALVVQAEFAGDGEPRAAVLREAASECLPDPAEAASRREEAQHAFDLYGQALFEHPADRISLEALRVIARELGHWQELAEVLAMVADHATADGPPWGASAFGAREIMREEARIAHEELGDDARAISVLSRELELADGLGATDLMPTLVVLDALYRAAGDDDARRDTLQRMATTAVDPIERASHLETLALLELGVDHIDEAIAGLEGALEELGAAPREVGRETRQRVLATLENVLQASERRVELVDLLVAAAATEDDAAEHRELLHRAAEVAADELGDGARAVALYGQLAAEDPHDEVALARLVA
ncbi:MAG: hypothetical protein JNJ59_18625, partial [Deltaproteobacteria bacterium]|nr:hypothetical protein [Deltaproteobacteria bacterium]